MLPAVQSLRLLIGEASKRIPPELRIDAACLVGAKVVSYQILGGKSTLTLEDGGGAMRRIDLRIDGSAVPPWRGNGKNKQFSVGESLEDAVTVSERGRLWTTD